MRTKKKNEVIKINQVEFSEDKNEPLSSENLINVSKDNLSRVLGFFPRVDSLTSIVLAIDISLLAVLATNSPPLQFITKFQVITSLIFLIIDGISLFFLYKCQFPRLECEEKSLLFFREIAELEQLEFARKFLEQTEKDYLHDLIKQVWRNSEILKLKFQYLKNAFRFLVLALLPWIISLLTFASENKQTFLNK